MGRGAADQKFDPNNQIAAVRWNDNRVGSVLTNFEDTECRSKVERRVKGGRQKVDIPACITTYNKYKNGVDLLDSCMETYFPSIQ
ncbi:hypothetical protein X975_10591, partial [Stegodyphus mimosarum]